MKRSKEMAMYDRKIVVVVAGKFAQETRPEEVRVMARAEGFALVRRKGCLPFAVWEKELRPIAVRTAAEAGKKEGQQQ